MFFFSNKHGVITTEEEQYLIEPLMNISSKNSINFNLRKGQLHVIYKKSSIPRPQDLSDELSCGVSGWWASVLAIWSTDVKEPLYIEDEEMLVSGTSREWK